MKELKFPLLNPNQIEVRVGQVTKKGYTLLLYKTSRTDAEILDQVVGVGNWQKKFYTLQGVGIGDNMRSIVVCSVGIYDDDKHEWIWKDDSGTESQVEQDKGICSDAFKRASGGSCWGIGRELYYTGFLFVKATTNQKTNGKGYELTDDDKYRRFEVSEISWKENPLSLQKLVIIDADTKEVILSRGTSAKVPTQAEKPQNKASNVSDEQYDKDVAIINTYFDSVPESKQPQFIDWVYKATGYNTLEKLFDDKAKTHRIAEVIRDNGK